MGSILEKFGIKNKSELKEWRQKEAVTHNAILHAFSAETDRQVMVVSPESTEAGHDGKG